MLALQIVTAGVNAILIGLLAIHCVHIFQLGGYRFKGFAKWAVARSNGYAYTLLAVALLGAGLAKLLTMFIGGIWTYFALLPYVFYAVVAIVLILRKPAKVPFKYTPRAVRLLLVTTLLAGFGTFALVFFAPIWALPLLPVGAWVVAGFVLLAGVINSPFEWCVRRTYLWRARRKLFSDEYRDVIRIGITGSYGKTSVKNILAQILAQKYVVTQSRASFNTPMGFCITVNRDLNPATNVLIMEMGARRVGDIKTMCKLFRPQHGILTSVGVAHLETFGNEENVRAEKMELVEAVKRAGGIAVNGAEFATRESQEGFVKKSLGGLKCPLLGFHNSFNVALAVEMSRKLGVGEKEIEKAVAGLKPTPHRLELIDNGAGVKILDDTYNSSPHGVVAALDVLAELTGRDLEKGGVRHIKSASTASFQAPRAIVVTPGMVELGAVQFEENRRFGEQMARVADVVLIIGMTNRGAIREGLGDFAGEVAEFATLGDAQKTFGERFRAGDVVLFENDLPDNY